MVIAVEMTIFGSFSLSFFEFSLGFSEETIYKFIMEVELGAGREDHNPFEIVHHARSSRASRSRKSSMHTMGTLDREKTKQNTKKLRKMTMNPEVSHFQ